MHGYFQDKKKQPNHQIIAGILDDLDLGINSNPGTPARDSDYVRPPESTDAHPIPKCDFSSG